MSKDPCWARACPCFIEVGEFWRAGAEVVLGMSKNVREKAEAESASVSSSADSRSFAGAPDVPY